MELKNTYFTIEPDQVISLALDIGELMVMCNAEITRVEDTIIRICDVYNLKRVDVFAITSIIIVSTKTDFGDTITQTRRIYASSTDLHKLEDLNSLSRYICKNRPMPDEAQKKIHELTTRNTSNSFMNFCGYVLASSSFTMFFGGNFIDFIATGIIAMLLFYIDTFVKKISNNQILYCSVCSIIAGYSAIILVKMGLGVNMDKIMIGDIMLLIPGIPLINSARDMLCGDIIAGVLRLVDAILIAVSIACGFAIPLITLGGMM